MRVCYFGPLEAMGNFGDDVTFESIHHIVTQVVGKHEIIKVDDQHLFEKTFSDDGDILIVDGTPWIWNGCTRSEKYENLKKVLEGYKNKPRIALSIGNSYTFAFAGEISSAESKELLDVWNQFDLVVTRDSLTFSILEKSGVSNLINGLDISIFLPDVYPLALFEGRHPCLYVYGKGAFNSGYMPKDYSEWVFNFQKKFVNDFTPKIISTYKKDANIKDLLFENTENVTSVTELVETFSYANLILSGKIHAAIPAFAYGIPTYLIPVDMRYIGPKDLGIRCLSPGSEFLFPYSREDFYVFEKRKTDFKRFLIKKISEVSGND